MIDNDPKVISVEVLKLKAPGGRTWGYRFILSYVDVKNKHSYSAYDVEFDFIPGVLESYLNYYAEKIQAYSFNNGVFTTEDQDHYNLPVTNVTGNQRRMSYLFSLLTSTPMLRKELRVNTKNLGFVEGLCILLESVVYESNHPDSAPNYVINIIGEDASAYARLFAIMEGMPLLRNKFSVIHQNIQTNGHSHDTHRLRLTQRELLTLLVSTTSVLGVAQETAVYFDSPYKPDPVFFTDCDVLEAVSSVYFKGSTKIPTDIAQVSLHAIRLQNFITFSDVSGIVQFLPGNSKDILDVLRTHQHIAVQDFYSWLLTN